MKSKEFSNRKKMKLEVKAFTTIIGMFSKAGLMILTDEGVWAESQEIMDKSSQYLRKAHTFIENDDQAGLDQYLEQFDKASGLVRAALNLSHNDWVNSSIH